MPLAKTWLRLAAHSSLLALLVAAGALAPVTALDTGDSSSNQFCDTLAARGDRIDARIDDVRSTVRSTWQQQSARLRVMVSEQQSSSDGLQRAIDSQRIHNLAQLRRSHTTSSQRAAINIYERTQANAGVLRRKAVHQANENFTAALKRFVADRQAAQAGQIEALKITIDDDIKSAENQCATDVDDATAAHEFANSILTARQTFAAQRKNDPVIVSQLGALNLTRQNAISLADQTYDSTMNQARQTLATASRAP
jgi:hypothetical protein